MKRYPDWPTRMTLWLLNHAQDAHAYGAWDCALMAASHLDTITGTELFSTHAGKYTDPATAAAYLSGLRVDGLAGLAASILGAPLDNPKMAQRGDIVAFNTDLGPALGVIDLSGLKILALNPSLTGFLRISRNLAATAWRV